MAKIFVKPRPMTAAEVAEHGREAGAVMSVLGPIPGQRFEVPADGMFVDASNPVVAKWFARREKDGDLVRDDAAGEALLKKQAADAKPAKPAGSEKSARTNPSEG